MSLAVRPASISDTERLERLRKLREQMDINRVSAVLLGASESLRYFTGLVWHQSERLLGALVTPTALIYIVPAFERSRVETLPHLAGDIATWDEEESPAALVASLAGIKGHIALDDALPLFIYHALARSLGVERLVDGAHLIRQLRLYKSASEIELIKYAMGLTLEVHKRAHAIMKPGIRASEVARYIDEQHKTLGATRSYVIDEPEPLYSRMWQAEREAQQAVFEAAQLGTPCYRLDDAARAVLSGHGLGPDYRLPGLPHRAGHGLGLEIHEEPYIVRGNETPLRSGMCFSNEPMIVVPERFGIRLEDHIHMSEDGPRWFTRPAKSPTEPFG